MPTNYQKTPIVDSLNRFVSDKSADIGELVGKSLPASIMAVDPTNTIATVNFEVQTKRNLGIVQCPIGVSEWIRYPWAKGTPGFVVAIDAYMGGMSGLGKGTATLSQQPNLSTLVWFPNGNVNLDPTDNKNAVVIYGPDGVIIRNKTKTASMVIDGKGNVTINATGNITATGSKNVTLIDGNGNSITMSSTGVRIVSL